MSSGLHKTLLLVEDEAILALAAKRRLENYGYAVLTASGGEAAVGALRGGAPIDLVLMDINLGGGMDGTEAAALILKDRDIPIVFLSSHTEPEIVERTEKITSYGYVVKNSSITVLDASIKMAFKLFEAKKKELEKERALALSERKYRLISENTSDGIVHVSPDYRIDYVSPAYGRQLGYPEEETLGKGVDGIAAAIHPDDRERFMATIRGAIQRKERALTYSYRARHIDGHYIWREDHAHFIYDEAGGFAGAYVSCRDVSERKRIEAELYESKRKAERLLNIAAQIIIETDADGTILLLNDSGHRILGYEPPELIGRNYYEVCLPPESRDEVAAYLRALSVGRAEIDELHENDAMTKTGERRRILWRNSLLSPEDGGRMGLFSSGEDVTERRRVEDELRRAKERAEDSERKLRGAHAIAKIGHWELDVPRGVFTFNDGFYDIFHTSAEELGGYEMSAEEYARRFVHPDDAYMVGEETKKIVATGDRHFSNQLEHRIIYADGGEGVISVRYYIEKDATGTTIKTYGVNQDITERKRIEEALREREEQYKFALEGSDLGEWDWDYTTGEVKRNARWAQMLGYTPRELESTLRQGVELRHPDDLPHIERAIADHIAGRSDHYSIEYRMRTKDGGYKWIHDCGKIMVRDEAGAPLRLCGTHADIDEAKRARDTINRLLEEKELLLKEVHHRVKNSMNTVVSLLALQEQSMGDEGAKRALKDAGARVRSVSLLYDKLYRSDDYAELTLDAYLSSLADEVLDNFPFAAAVALEKDLRGTRLDARRLQTVGIIVNELMTDMMKYAFTGRPGGRIVLRSREDGGTATVMIEDDGVGLPPSESCERSSGFGLQLVGALAKQLGGSIRIERDAGTRFTLSFPIADA